MAALKPRMMTVSNPSRAAMRRLPHLQRSFSPSTWQARSSSFAPRHLLSIADLAPAELATLVRRSSFLKQSAKSGLLPLPLTSSLNGKTVAMTFSKRSTRTRVSTESAVATMGGHPLFLGKDDIQLGVNESLCDTSVVVSSMVAAWVARVGRHSDVVEIARHSTVPVINALSDAFHPLQILADVLTLVEAFPSKFTAGRPAQDLLGLEGLKVAWIGDANNVLFDLAIAASKLGVSLAVATPKGYEIPASMMQIISDSRAPGCRATFTTTCVPEEAVRDANVIVTDTWISMGQEAESDERRKAFEGFQVTFELAKRGGADAGWKFMHCLPRHLEEVSDEVFYGPNSLVFPEAENRLWAAIAALEAFVVDGGKFAPS